MENSNEKKNKYYTKADLLKNYYYVGPTILGHLSKDEYDNDVIRIFQSKKDLSYVFFKHYDIDKNYLVNVAEEESKLLEKRFVKNLDFITIESQSVGQTNKNLNEQAIKKPPVKPNISYDKVENNQKQVKNEERKELTKTSSKNKAIIKKKQQAKMPTAEEMQVLSQLVSMLPLVGVAQNIAMAMPQFANQNMFTAMSSTMAQNVMQPQTDISQMGPVSQAGMVSQTTPQTTPQTMAQNIMSPQPETNMSQLNSVATGGEMPQTMPESAVNGNVSHQVNNSTLDNTVQPPPTMEGNLAPESENINLLDDGIMPKQNEVNISYEQMGQPYRSYFMKRYEDTEFKVPDCAGITSDYNVKVTINNLESGATDLKPVNITLRHLGDMDAKPQEIPGEILDSIKRNISTMKEYNLSDSDCGTSLERLDGLVINIDDSQSYSPETPAFYMKGDNQLFLRKCDGYDSALEIPDFNSTIDHEINHAMSTSGGLSGIRDSNANYEAANEWLTEKLAKGNTGYPYLNNIFNTAFGDEIPSSIVEDYYTTNCDGALDHISEHFGVDRDFSNNFLLNTDKYLSNIYDSNTMTSEDFAHLSKCTEDYLGNQALALRFSNMQKNNIPLTKDFMTDMAVNAVKNVSTNPEHINMVKNSPTLSQPILRDVLKATSYDFSKTSPSFPSEKLSDYFGQAVQLAQDTNTYLDSGVKTANLLQNADLNVLKQHNDSLMKILEPDMQNVLNARLQNLNTFFEK